MRTQEDLHELVVAISHAEFNASTINTVVASDIDAISEQSGFGRIRDKAAATCHCPSTMANMSGATIDASDSILKLGFSGASLPHVIFSLGNAPEYPPYDVVESVI